MPSQLPDSFTDAYMKEFGIPPPPDVITHCRRELFHEVVKLILEGRFAEAYKHGILIMFPDGITRRVFPRFYSYSADYPEKYVTNGTGRACAETIPKGFSLPPSRIWASAPVPDASPALRTSSIWERPVIPKGVRRQGSPPSDYLLQSRRRGNLSSKVTRCLAPVSSGFWEEGPRFQQMYDR